MYEPLMYVRIRMYSSWSRTPEIAIHKYISHAKLLLLIFVWEVNAAVQSDSSTGPLTINHKLFGAPYK